MQPRTILLLGGLAAAVALYLRARTERGQVAAVDAVESLFDEIDITAKRIEPALEFIDVTAGRIKAAVLSRGYRNNNPGNLRYLARNAWNGQSGNDGGYGIYSSAALGTRALARQLLKYAAGGLDTVRGIVTKWAPPTENNTGAYVNAVAKALGVGPDARIDVQAHLPALARAIAKHENGYIDASYDFNAWVYL